MIETSIELRRIDFDELNDSNPNYETVVGRFFDDTDGTAMSKAHRFIGRLPETPLYMGWDGKTYPNYVTVHKPTREIEL